MDYKNLSEILYPNISKTVSDWEAVYPKRSLKEGAFVTRFAPSPTGFIHIGGIYIAVAAERLARQSGGVYMLRIEDTDKNREKDNGVNEIVDSLAQFGLAPDEGVFNNGEEKGDYGPYMQSNRIDIYHSFAKHLVSLGRAYPSFATSEELDAIRKEQEASKIKPGYYGVWAKDRELSIEEVEEKIKNGVPYVIRLKSLGVESPRQFHDEVKGNISVPLNDQDSILLKADGYPTYHFAHLVDDFLMGTTHVIRGDEWLASLPLHIELFEAFGFPLPKYAHLAPIMKLDGTKRKLSKRKDPEAAVTYYVEHGYPSVAVIEYVLNLLNSAFEDWRKENPTLSYTEFPVRLDKMSVSGALMDIVKLGDISKNIIGAMSADELYENTFKWAKVYDTDFAQRLESQKDYSLKVLAIERGGDNPRKDFAMYSEIKDGISYMYDDLYSIDSAKNALSTVLTPEKVSEILNAFSTHDIKATHKDEWFAEMKSIATELGYAPDGKTFKANPDQYKGSIADVAMVLRIALTERTKAPDMYAVMNVFGVEQSKMRFKNLA
jgi:glutamyl-tRNA synthetase